MARKMPLRIVLLGLFLFAYHALAASAVLGVDLGTEYIKAALVKPGTPLEIVLTKDSRRKETSAVAFKPPSSGAPKPGTYPERAYGSDAIALSARFPGDVYPNLKSLLGLSALGNSDVSEYAMRHPALKIEPYEGRGSVAFKSTGAFVPSEDAWMVEELLAMQLKSVRRNAEALAGPETSVRSVVITVPAFYTTDEKRAVELAANLAGLRVLSLISDGLAVGVNYATSRHFPSITDGGRPEVHMVFDMGAGSTKATILQFQSRNVKISAGSKYNKTVQEVDVLGNGWDRTLGGDTLNALIIDDMITQFAASPGAKAAGVTEEKVRAHGRTIAKLTKESERVRHVLSANSNTAASFEGLFEDVDFRYKISRVDFEAMASAHTERVNAVVQAALDVAGLKVSDLDSVILHGGATRTPFVQKQLEQALGGPTKLRTNVNSDEAAVFGAGFRAAELSPSFRVKEIKISEAAVYGVTLKPAVTAAKAEAAEVASKDPSVLLDEKKLWVPTSHLGAVPQELVFQVSDASKAAEQSAVFYQQVPRVGGELVDAATKTFKTDNLTATIDQLVEKYSCEPSSVQFKLGLRLNSENGEVEITKSVATCESDAPEKESLMDGVKNLFGFGKNKDQQPLKDGEEAAEDGIPISSSITTSPTSTKEASSNTSSSTATAPSAASPEDSKAPEKVDVTIPVKFTLEKAGMPQLTDEQLQKIKKRLQAFDASDRARLQREEVFNQLEGFTYKVRSLLESEEFVAASTAAERATLETMSSEASDWLYGDGADASHDEIKKKYTALKTPVDAIEARINEAAKRPQLIASLKEALKQSRDFTDSIRERIVEYDAFHAKASSSSSTSTTTASMETPATEFDGLEDDEPAAHRAAEAPSEDLGPVPPMYTIEDLKESEELAVSVAAWLAKMEEAQARLGPADDPVLTTKDLQAKRDRLDKLGMELAMKAVRNFDKVGGKKGSSSGKSAKPSRSKTSSNGKASTSTVAASSGKSESTTKATADEEIKHEEL